MGLRAYPIQGVIFILEAGYSNVCRAFEIALLFCLIAIGSRMAMADRFHFDLGID